MKNNKLVLLIVLLAVLVAAYLYYTQSSTTLIHVKGAKFDFAIEDTNSIDKVFIADAQGGSITLVRGKNGWLVNEKYKARPDNIRLLMKTFSRIAVKSPVPKASFETVVKKIATGATKVEIYQGAEKPSKIYYLGGSTMDQTGTYMLLETEGVKSTVPYIMHIPGFRGFLTSRFFTNNDEWRDPVIFNYAAKDINKLEVTYFEDEKQSFFIERNNAEIELLDGSRKKLKGFPKERLEEYLSRYEKIYYEMMDIESTKEKIDSVITSTPFFKIKLEDVFGSTKEIVAYHMPNFRTTLNPVDGTPFEYDVDRMYGYVNNELFVYIQFATFDEITIKKDDFLIKE